MRTPEEGTGHCGEGRTPSPQGLHHNQLRREKHGRGSGAQGLGPALSHCLASLTAARGRGGTFLLWASVSPNSTNDLQEPFSSATLSFTTHLFIHSTNTVQRSYVLAVASK